jgi:hypothetical protein
MSEYRLAIDLSIIVLTKRAKTFRNQIVAVVMFTLIVITASIAFYSPKQLVALLTLAPLCGFFLFLDAKLLADWRAAVLAVWARRDIDLLAFSHAIRAVPHLPEATLTSMLSLLGTAQVGKAEAQASAQTRQAVVAVVRFAGTLELCRLAAKVCATGIVTVSICWAAVGQAWQPLGLLGATLLLPLILQWLQTSLQLQPRAAVMAAKQHPDFDIDIFRSLTQVLPLGRGLLLADICVDSEPAKP